jgi:hypothetical protein
MMMMMMMMMMNPNFGAKKENEAMPTMGPRNVGHIARASWTKLPWETVALLGSRERERERR